jgi:hypothetical protein
MRSIRMDGETYTETQPRSGSRAKTLERIVRTNNLGPQTPGFIPAPSSGPKQILADPHSPRLDSWKAIATYLGREVRTVQRWERREHLPIHRHFHNKTGSVFAFRHEIDEWRETRRVTKAVSNLASGQSKTSSRSHWDSHNLAPADSSSQNLSSPSADGAPLLVFVLWIPSSFLGDC